MNLIKVFFLTCFLSFVVLSAMSAQVTVGKKDFSIIKKNVIKNIVLYRMVQSAKWTSGSGYFPENYFFWRVDYLGFGYAPKDIQCTISPKLKLEYPDKELSLYEVSFDDCLKNDSLRGFYNSEIDLLWRKNILVGLDNNMNFKCISGCGYNSSLVKDFKIRKNSPNTYIPFLKFKYYYLGLDSISFLRKIDEKYVFFASKTDSLGAHDYEIEIDCKNPEKFSIRYVGKIYYGSRSVNKLDLNFGSFGNKKLYLLDALMKNYYCFKINHIPALFDKLNIDTSNMLMLGDSRTIDSMLPDYDMVLGNMGVITFDIRLTKNECRKEWPPFQKLIGHGDYDVVGTSINDDVELYRIYKDTTDLLCEVHNTRMYYTGYCKYDYYYEPFYKKQAQDWEREVGGEMEWPTISEGPRWNGDLSCSFFIPNTTKPSTANLDYYLLGLDVKTREVFFVSGRDIYLSKSAKLYLPGSEGENENFSDWPMPYKLEYIKDRLYQYQVLDVKESNIVSKDAEKMVLQVHGSERGVEMDLKVTFRNADPEELLIEKLP